MITYLSADNGKLQLHDDTKKGVVFESSDPIELAQAFVAFGMPEDQSFRTSSSFDFGVESGFKTDDAVHKLFHKVFTIINVVWEM
tara:strand:+ start:129 stop:383 length:255 start_codon:yes stop_codon:yes gene_type:complete